MIYTGIDHVIVYMQSAKSNNGQLSSMGSKREVRGGRGGGGGGSFLR